MDFTIHTYRKLIETLLRQGFSFYTFAEFLENSSSLLTPLVILRHDVDAHPQNALHFAEIQSSYGIRGTYYFRIVPGSFHPQIIRKISALGHEIGYHYETMDTSHGDRDKAYEEFCRNLEKFRAIVPVKTISMHGSPLSAYDNRLLWEEYDYRSLGIIGEPYFDLDFNEVFYLTDTGRRWDGDRVNIRDRAAAQHQISNTDFLHRRYRTTHDIINALNRNDFPRKVMLNFHPQRWNDQPVLWLKELVFQKMKNAVKWGLLKYRQWQETRTGNQ